MPPSDTTKRKLLASWINKADDDLAIAEDLLANRAPRTNGIAFHCQQAAEKYLKAYLAWHDVEFPKTHDLEQLLLLVQTVNSKLAVWLQSASALTPYGVELRYPGDRPDATLEQAREAFQLAQNVRKAVFAALPMLKEQA